MNPIANLSYRFAILQAFLFGLVGGVLGLLYALGGAVIDLFVTAGWLESTSTSGLGTGTFLALFALIGMPLISAAIGLLFGILETFLFNITRKWHPPKIQSLFSQVQI